jgi:hypothetical protein
MIFHTYTGYCIWETAGKIFKFYNFTKTYFSTSKTQYNLCEMENLYILTLFEKKWGKISYIFVAIFNKKMKLDMNCVKTNIRFNPTNNSFTWRACPTALKINIQKQNNASVFWHRRQDIRTIVSAWIGQIIWSGWTCLDKYQ